MALIAVNNKGLSGSTKLKFNSFNSKLAHVKWKNDDSVEKVDTTGSVVFSSDYSLINIGNAKLVTTDDALEQTVIDLSGSAGVLTAVLSPTCLSAGDTIIIRIELDGVVHTYTRTAMIADQRLCVGAFIRQGVEGTAAGGAGWGSGVDYGTWVNDPVLLMLTPEQAVFEAGLGAVFNHSLKVTVQLSAMNRVSSNNYYAGVQYLDYLPEGVH